MKRRVEVHAGAAALALAAGALLPSLVLAQSSPTAGEWQYSASVNVYLPTISANTQFPVSSGGANLSLDANTILENLNMTFMGSFEAQNGRWGMFTDVVYVDLGNSKSGVHDFTIGNVGLPAGTSSYMNLDIKATLWTLVGEYRVAAEPGYTVDLLAGARYLDLETRLNWSIEGNLGSIPAGARTGTSTVGGSNWDALVGAKGRFTFGEGGKWAVPVYLDVGAGDSDLTWQGAVGLGYAFHWGEVAAMWRYIDYQFKDSKIEDMSTNGPMIGIIFRW